MKTSSAYDIIIVGAGLSGLSLAYYLRNTSKRILLLEARPRLGGRIHTLRPHGLDSHVEMGATWFGAKHVHMMELLHALKLPFFEQNYRGKALFESMSFTQPQVFAMPEEGEPTYRIEGGSETLIQALADSLSKATEIQPGKPVVHIREQQHGIEVETADATYQADKVVLCTPPNLAVQLLHGCDLEEDIIELMQATHTWMHDAIKFALVAHRPLWKEQGFSGTFFSQVGPVVEMYDHSNAEQSFYSLKGFLASSLKSYSSKEREEAVREQMQKCLPFYEASAFDYIECVWSEETYTASATNINYVAHQHNGHPQLRAPLVADKIYLGASETAKSYPGYMDGAVERAKELNNLIMEQWSN